MNFHTILQQIALPSVYTFLLPSARMAWLINCLTHSNHRKMSYQAGALLITYLNNSIHISCSAPYCVTIY